MCRALGAIAADKKKVRGLRIVDEPRFLRIHGPLRGNLIPLSVRLVKANPFCYILGETGAAIFFKANLNMLKWPINPYSMVLIAAACSAWAKPSSAGSGARTGRVYFVLLMSSVAWWAATAALNIHPTGFAARLWNAKFQYLSVASRPLYGPFSPGHGQYLKKIKPLYQACCGSCPSPWCVAFTNERTAWSAGPSTAPRPGRSSFMSTGRDMGHWTYSYLFF